MNCCQIQRYTDAFDARLAAEELVKYRKSGPRKETRMLLEALKTNPIQGATLLDIGGGVGAISLDLLESGAAHAVDVDASLAYLDAARQEAARRQHADQITFRHGDFVALSGEIEAADIVTLDRVICCYPDMQHLVQLSAARARRLYGLVYPRDTWWIRALSRLANLALRVTRFPIPIFVHSSQAVDAIAAANGLEKLFHRETLIWQVVVYTRSA